MANKKDFATSTVLTAPSPADSGTSLVVTAGHGARFPASPFYVTVHPPSEMPTLDNAEKLLVSTKSDDTFTITRAQGDTTAKSIEAGWRISNTLFLEDIPDTFDDLADGTTNKAYTTTEKTKLAAITGTNTGDQTSIVGITGTTAQFNTANTDGDFATLAGTETLTNKTLSTGSTLDANATIAVAHTASGTQSCLHNTTTTFYTATAPGMYLVSVWFPSDEASNPYMGFAVVSVDGTTRNKIHLSNFGTAITVTMSNLAMQMTQLSGVTLVMRWSVLRLA